MGVSRGDGTEDTQMHAQVKIPDRASHSRPHKAAHGNGELQTRKPGKLKRKDFERHLEKLQEELVQVQEWVKREGKRIIIIFEGRDAAGKGGVIKRVTERVSPRVFRVVALPAPTEREKTQAYFQRYLSQFPAAGEVIIFDCSWCNRAAGERVRSVCS